MAERRRSKKLKEQDEAKQLSLQDVCEMMLSWARRNRKIDQPPFDIARKVYEREIQNKETDDEFDCKTKE